MTVFLCLHRRAICLNSLRRGEHQSKQTICPIIYKDCHNWMECQRKVTLCVRFDFLAIYHSVDLECVSFFSPVRCIWPASLLLFRIYNGWVCFRYLLPLSQSLISITWVSSIKSQLRVFGATSDLIGIHRSASLYQNTQ